MAGSTLWGKKQEVPLDSPLVETLLMRELGNMRKVVEEMMVHHPIHYPTASDEIIG